MLESAPRGAARPFPIIDVDTHYTEPADLWTSRAPARLRDRVLHTEIDELGIERWRVGDAVIASIGPGVVTPAGQKTYGTFSLPTLADMAPSQTDPAKRLESMDRTGISAALLYPNVVGFGAARIMEQSKDTELSLFHMQAYNDAMADLQKAGQGRLFPQAVLPLWDIEASLKELRRCREDLGLTGVVLADTPASFGQPSFVDPVWGPLFATCQDLELPINFHVGFGETDNKGGFWGRTDNWPPKNNEFDPHLMCYVGTQLFMNNVKDILNLLLTGILDKFPRLKFVSVESGIGYIPFLIRSVEWTMEELLLPADRAKFKRPVRQMFQEQIYASFWFEDANALESYAREFGVDNLLFETDFPHPQCLYPDIHDKIGATLANFDDATKRKILFENASRLYKIPIPA